MAILGAGAEGCALAVRAARAGYTVTLEDLMPGKRRAAAEVLATLPPAHAVILAATVEEAARDADLVVDFVPDELESKLEIFSLLDRMAPPHTIFATPTRVLSIADLASCTYRADRCVALRAENWLQGGEGEAIELVHAPAVGNETLAGVTEFLVSLGARVARAVDRAPLP